MMATIITHNGTACLGINSDGAAVTDQELFAECLVARFGEVLALAADDDVTPGELKRVV